jgi:hypothetical protein
LATDLNIPKELEESLPIAFQNAAEIDMIVINGRTSLHLSDSVKGAYKNYASSAIHGKWGMLCKF